MLVRFMVIMLPLLVSAQSDRAFKPVGNELKRVALVIGNEQYESAPLANAVADAGAIRAFLERVGFKVHFGKNVDHRQMDELVEKFKYDLNRNTVGLFFFSGHGLNIDGENYLIPVGAKLRDETDVKYNCLPASLVVSKMVESGAHMALVFLDACRNNPFTRGIRAENRGLASINAGAGTLIAYATSPGMVASDGGSLPNGLYTHYLLKHMKTPGLALEQAIKRTAGDVARASDREQIPWFNSSLLDDFYFIPTHPGGEQVGNSWDGTWEYRSVNLRGEDIGTLRLTTYGDSIIGDFTNEGQAPGMGGVLYVDSHDDPNELKGSWFNRFGQSGRFHFSRKGDAFRGFYSMGSAQPNKNPWDGQRISPKGRVSIENIYTHVVMSSCYNEGRQGINLRKKILYGAEIDKAEKNEAVSNLTLISWLDNGQKVFEMGMRDRWHFILTEVEGRPQIGYISSRCSLSPTLKSR